MSEENDNRKPVAERRLAPVRLLGIWWKSMPDWAKEAYHNDPTINRVMTECSLIEMTAHEMQWRVCAAMYEQRNQWRETAIHLKEQMPIAVKMPNAGADAPATKNHDK